MTPSPPKSSTGSSSVALSIDIGIVTVLFSDDEEGEDDTAGFSVEYLRQYLSDKLHVGLVGKSCIFCWKFKFFKGIIK